jgi:hypothetical protein
MDVCRIKGSSSRATPEHWRSRREGERNKPTPNVYHNLSLSSSSATSPNPCHSPICASPFPACPTPAPTAGCARSNSRGIKHPMTLAASLLTFCVQQFGSDIWQAGLVVHKPDRQWFSGEGFNQLPLAADAERHHIGATELATPKPWFSHDFCLAPFLPSLESCLPAIRWITGQRPEETAGQQELRRPTYHIPRAREQWQWSWQW